ncbi:MAG: SelA-like pyridoxal phosphate-dependent enzyme, partial [Chloroflexota bacterium]|nr:SelA-like pyridoxal phosphate-dependent enzyme [Chloroflexota bacterium]
IAPEVAAAMAQAGQDYINIDDLQLAVGREIAAAIGAEDAMVTTGAAAGIVLMVAACIAGDDLTRVQSLPDPLDAPNEIVIQAGHQVNFGAPVNQMIALGGGRVRAVGAVNGVREEHLRGAFGPRTAAFLFIQSHHTVQKGMLSLQECIRVCREHGVRVIVDAAAEENLSLYPSLDVDLVTFSGGKAIEGPASGIVAGRAQLVEACRVQRHGIGRPMKVGKEVVVGLYEAVSRYGSLDMRAERERQSEIVDEMMAGFGACPGAHPTRLEEEAGRGIERAGLQLDREEASELMRFLQVGNPPIYPRSHLLNLGIVAFDPRPLTMADASIIVERVREFYSRGSADRAAS